jgi:hypothetical protein
MDVQVGHKPIRSECAYSNNATLSIIGTANREEQLQRGRSQNTISKTLHFACPSECGWAEVNNIYFECACCGDLVRPRVAVFAAQTAAVLFNEI